MATITTINPGSGYRRSGAAQADTGQTDWLTVPGWARFAKVHFRPTLFAGTTPVATLTLLAADPVALDDGRVIKVAEHTALTGLTTSAVDEVQTLNISAGAAGDVIKLTFNTHESAAITFPTGGFANTTAAQVKAALITISDWTGNAADIAVVKTTNAYAITFTGPLGATDLGAITVTSVTGTGAGSVAATTAGVPGAALTVDIGPGITGIADDVTNSATVASSVALNAVLPSILGLRLLLDRTTGDEVYTYNLSCNFRA